MQIPSSVQGKTEITRDWPVRIRDALLQGQKIEAVVIAKLSAEVAKVKIGDTILQLKTDPAIQAGQTVTIERQAASGEIILKPVAASPIQPDPILDKLVSLKQGQTVAVEVIKLLANKQLLVKPVLLAQPDPATQRLVAALPAQIEIDMKAIRQTPPKIGERLMMEVIREQPLSVNLKLDRPSRAEQTQQYQRALFPQLDKPAQVIERLNKLLPKLVALPVVQKAVSELFQHVTDKPLLQRPEVLYQAIQRSGVFLETNIKKTPENFQSSIHQFDDDVRAIKKPVITTPVLTTPTGKSASESHTSGSPSVPVNRGSSFFAIESAEPEAEVSRSAQPTERSQLTTSVQQDFKANVLKLSQVVHQQIQVMGQQSREHSDKIFQSLPSDIREAIQQVVRSPEAMQKLPVQIQSFLATQGRTPANLLVGLLSTMTTNTAVPSTPSTPVSPLLSSPLSNVMPQVISASQHNSATKQGQTMQLAELQVLRDFVRELDSVSARIQSHQLHMVRDSDAATNTNVWLFDLPVKDRQQLELMQMRIEQRKQSTEEESVWQVQLNLETMNLGPMQAQISFFHNQVSVVLVAERPASAALLKADMHELEQRLYELGVSVSHIDCRQAPVTELNSDIIPAADSDSLVDISV